MLNFIWPIFIIISFSYGIITGRVNEINTGIFNSTEEAVKFYEFLVSHSLIDIIGQDTIDKVIN